MKKKAVTTEQLPQHDDAKNIQSNSKKTNRKKESSSEYYPLEETLEIP